MSKKQASRIMVSLLAAALLMVPLSSGCDGTQLSSSRTRAALSDTDGDGVIDAADLCPGSSGSVPVNAFGCPDADQDGVTDEKDLCPQTPTGTVVKLDGCEYVGTVATPGEVYRPRLVPAPEITGAIFRNQLGYLTPETCAGDHQPPRAPTVTSPAFWSVEFAASWTPSATVTVVWDAVTDDCAPLTYGIQVERWDASAKKWYLEPERGHVRLSATTHQFSWPWNEKGRYRVWARDANGQRSTSTSWRYFVFATMDPPVHDRFREPRS